MKRIGLLTMALVLALGSLGVAYAAWTDEITIEGTVSTGDVDLNVVRYSNTWVFKKLDTDALVYSRFWDDEAPTDEWLKEQQLLLVASADAKPGEADDSVIITFDNLFPCQYFTADLLLQYDGSIPAKLWANIDPMGEDCTKLLEAGTEVTFVAYRIPAADVPLMGAADPWAWVKEMRYEPANIGVQVHDGDQILVAMTIHLPQDNSLMNLDCDFEAVIQAIQWNEWTGGYYTHD